MGEVNSTCGRRTEIATKFQLESLKNSECWEHLWFVGKAVRNLPWMKVALERDNLGDH